MAVRASMYVLSDLKHSSVSFLMQHVERHVQSFILCAKEAMAARVLRRVKCTRCTEITSNLLSHCSPLTKMSFSHAAEKDGYVRAHICAAAFTHQQAFKHSESFAGSDL